MDPRSNSDTYLALRPLLQRVFERFRARGQGVRDAARYLGLRCSPALRPHLLRFYRELAQLDHRTVASAEWHESAGIEQGVEQGVEQGGVHNGGRTPGQSIEQLAYLLAEEAGFKGDPTQFWQQAEQLIKQRRDRS